MDTKLSHERRQDIKPGTRVKIVLKKDQPTGILTEGVVQDLLTNKPYHPRGIKVRLTDGQVGRVQHILPKEPVNTVEKPKSIIVVKKAKEEEILDMQNILYMQLKQEEQESQIGLQIEYAFSEEETEMLQQAISLGLVLVAKKEEEIVAYGVAKQEKTPWYTSVIGNICRMVVKEAYQHKGIEVGMIKQLKEELYRQGIQTILLEIPISQQPLASSLQALGFQPTSNRYIAHQQS